VSAAGAAAAVGAPPGPPAAAAAVAASVAPVAPACLVLNEALGRVEGVVPPAGPSTAAAAGTAATPVAVKAETAAAGAAGGPPDEARIRQEEADAVAALLDFGSEELTAPPPAAAADAAAGVGGGFTAALGPLSPGLTVIPPGVHHGVTGLGVLSPGMHGLGPLGESPGGLLLDAPLHQEPEYLVKWTNKAHIHDEWVREGVLMGMARRKLLNFKKRHGDAPCNFQEEQWTIPERCVARRPSPSAPGWQVRQ
jgi:hypothetical protein